MGKVIYIRDYLSERRNVEKNRTSLLNYLDPPGPVDLPLDLKQEIFQDGKDALEKGKRDFDLLVYDSFCPSCPYVRFNVRYLSD